MALQKVVTPLENGVQVSATTWKYWIPAFAGMTKNYDIRSFRTFYEAIKLDELVKRQNNGAPRGRYRHRYRTLIGGVFDPDTDPDPDADKAEMVLFANS